MKISFVVPLFNCLPLTQAMLASLRETLPAGLASEIILVDDGSTDGTRAWVQSVASAFGAEPASARRSGPPAGGSPAIRFLFNDRNSGFAASCNRGAAAATGEFVFFLNNDLVLLPRWLEPMLAVFDREPDAGLVGNVQLSVATGAVDHAGIYFNHQGKPAHRTDLPWSSRWLGLPALREVDALTGACFGLRRAAWEKLGGFDEGYINGAEDVDLALRASAAGLRHYVALRSVVRHHISASVGRKLRDEQNTFRLLSRWQEQVVTLAARDWSRHFITQHWDQSFVYDDIRAREALYCWLGLSPTAGVRAGVRAALAVEFARWERMLRSG